MVSIEKYNVQREYEVSSLCVKPEQTEFTIANIPNVITNLNKHEHPHLIIFNDQVVGFFILDSGYSENYDFCPPKSLGIRALLVDYRFQGQGIARKTLLELPSYVRTIYPNFETLYLTVNCRNTAAYECYTKCNFQDTGDLYLDGPVGPQHIMMRRLA